MNGLNAVYENLCTIIEGALKGRKNLFIYEGIKDGLENNIKYKFFYSNPFDPLEFINIDMLERVEFHLLDKKKIKIYGTITIIKEQNDFGFELMETNFGIVSIENIQVRDIPKNRIILKLNENGITDIDKAIIHFESNYCKKTVPENKI